MRGTRRGLGNPLQRGARLQFTMDATAQQCRKGSTTHLHLLADAGAPLIPDGQRNERNGMDLDVAAGRRESPRAWHRDRKPRRRVPEGRKPSGTARWEAENANNRACRRDQTRGPLRRHLQTRARPTVSIPIQTTCAHRAQDHPPPILSRATRSRAPRPARRRSIARSARETTSARSRPTDIQGAVEAKWVQADRQSRSHPQRPGARRAKGIAEVLEVHRHEDRAPVGRNEGIDWSSPTRRSRSHQGAPPTEPTWLLWAASSRPARPVIIRR